MLLTADKAEKIAVGYVDLHAQTWRRPQSACKMGGGGKFKNALIMQTRELYCLRWEAQMYMEVIPWL